METLERDDNKQRLRRILQPHRSRHQFKPSFLHPDPSLSLPPSFPRQLLTHPVSIPASNLVPWMDAYNKESRQVVLHQGAIRSKARNPPPEIGLSQSPVLPDSIKPVPIMKRSYTQAVLPPKESPEVTGTKTREREEIRLCVRGSASMRGRRDLELGETGKLVVNHSSPVTAVDRKHRENRVNPISQPSSDVSVFKYFNAGVIPSRENHKVTVEDVRKYIAYMEVRHFR